MIWVLHAIRTIAADVLFDPDLISVFSQALMDFTNRGENKYRVFIMHPRFYKNLVKSGFSCARRRVRDNKPLFDHDWIMVPIYDNQKWMLIMVDCVLHYIIIYDPVSSSDNQSLQIHQQNIKEYLLQEANKQRESNNEVPNFQWKLDYVFGTQKPENSGEFICGCMKSRVQDLRSYLSDNTWRDLRIDVMDHLLFFYSDKYIRQTFKDKSLKKGILATLVSDDSTSSEETEITNKQIRGTES